uniref:Tr-type G domain-containing protein n=1 Tax=Romanomermis culicivorax TaxID=13658 RepID=A0A915K0U9_ROMCU
MSRHRNLRKMDLDDECNDDEDDDYSNSYEDHYSISPGTGRILKFLANQFIYNRSDVNKEAKLHDYIEEDSVVEDREANFPDKLYDDDFVEKQDARRPSSALKIAVVDSSSPTPPIPIKNAPLVSTSSAKKNYAGRNSGPAKISVPSTSSGTLFNKSNRQSSSPFLAQMAIDRLKVGGAGGESSPGPSSRSESPMKIGPKTPARLKIRPENVKPVLNLVVVGHVDAGKSTLMGHFLYLMGQINQKTMHKYKQDSQKVGKGSFAYAWVLDEGSEERARGVTIDVARARFSTQNFDVVLLDAPGHKDFIPNMISGAAEADAAILVINSTTGEFETGFDLGGQTREHTMLVRSLGVNQLVVAVNKLDTVDWSKQRFDDICSKMRGFLKQTGFSNTIFVPCCGLSGENLIQTPTDDKDGRKHPLMEWYNGPCLLEAIDNFKTPEKIVDAPLRLIVSDIFKSATSSTPLISGKIESGAIQLNDKIVIMPSGQTGVVKAIQTDESMEAQAAYGGDQIILSLTSAGAADLLTNNPVTSGDIVCHPESPVSCVQRFQAR